MWIGAVSGKMRRGPAVAAALAAVLMGAAAWQRPWSDSVMRAVVSISTDENGLVATHTARGLFRAGADARPACVIDVDLGRLEGERALVVVEGTVGRRGVSEGTTGTVACRAAVVDSAGAAPVEFVGWRHGAEMNLHVGPVGSPAYRLEGGGEERNPPFVYSLKGPLRHVLEVPRGARLRVWVRPVMWEDLPGRPELYESEPGRVEHVVGGRGARARARPPDVFIYVIDALRADHLGCYGYGRGTSPAIDGFAAGATRYEQARTPTTWTRPSVATMLTGLYPSVHGAMHDTDGLDEWPVLLPEILQEAGYATLCVTGNPHIDEAFGFSQGYDEFVMRRAGTAAWVNSKAARFLAQQGAGRPVFLYLHTMEPHDPYTPRGESRRRFDRGFQGRCDGSVEGLVAAGRVNPKLSPDDIAHLVDLYDAEVFDADRGFADFLELLRSRGRFENALIVLVADHGEGFAEHDTLCHGRNLNVEEMHVPLILRFPGGRFAGMQVSEPVSLIDLLPTLLAEVGISPKLSYALQGRVLPPLAGASEPPRPRRFHAEVSQFGGNELDLVGVIDEDGYKRVVDVSAPPRETAARKSVGLWDTRADPREEVDLSERLPVRSAYDEQLIAQWLLEQRRARGRSAAEPAPKVLVGDELRKQLQSLGYLRGARLSEEPPGPGGERGR